MPVTGHGFRSTSSAMREERVDLHDQANYREETTPVMNRISTIAIIMMITLAGGVRPGRR